MQAIINVLFNLKTIVIGIFAYVLVVINSKNNKISEQKDEIEKKDVQIDNMKADIEKQKDEEVSKQIHKEIKDIQLTSKEEYQDKKQSVEAKINNMKDGDEITITV